MNELQQKIAIEAIRILGERNGHSEMSRLKGTLHQVFGFENRGEVAFVLGKLDEDYGMIYKQDNWYCLSMKGDTALKVGVDRYFQKIHSSHRIDLEMKRLEVISKWLDIIQKGSSITISLISLLTGFLSGILSRSILKIILSFFGAE
ncbi:hypothetical protein [Parabacteroides goldsteinii]|uniref:hypothetical protein n=1 Tax=Parabacteroides goldsteinii TaxID=328812 RepID=UPI002675259C|nr:hypothetical protein [Parabacteroides goldsteinii]